MRRRLVVLGDCLLDRDLEGEVERLSPEAPVPVVDEPVESSRPGGAGLAAALAAADGDHVLLVTALGRDRAGGDLVRLLQRADVELVDVGLEGPTPEKVRVRGGGRTLVRLDLAGRAAGGVGDPDPWQLAALRDVDAVLVSDYGRGLAAKQRVREALARCARRMPVVWDPHPRGPEPVAGSALVTPNRSEAQAFAARGDGVEGPRETELAAIAAQAAALRDRWGARGVAVTMGSEGALLVTEGVLPMAIPARERVLGDPCGAGDQFASRAASVLGAGGDLADAVREAVLAATEFVARGGAAGAFGHRPASEERQGAESEGGVEAALRVVQRVRRRGGRVMAAGGCFDLLHAGHVSMLRQARGLGDCLVVCLNSDASVRRLKGRSRPLVEESDRAAVLRALACVDAVVVFDEDTPESVLRRLRPDVFVKGGDYAGSEVPEARVVSEWGGQAVVLPYLEGRSTSGLVEEALRRVAS